MAKTQRCHAEQAQWRTSIQSIKNISELFEIEGGLISAVPYGNGHINDTFLAVYRFDEDAVRYIHQRINKRVFPDPVALMENFERLTSHISSRLEAGGQEDIDRRVLSLVRSRSVQELRL